MQTNFQDMWSRLSNIFNPSQSMNPIDQGNGAYTTPLGNDFAGGGIQSSDLGSLGSGSSGLFTPQAQTQFDALQKPGMSGVQGFGTAIQGLMALNNIINSSKQYRLAKDQFNFTRDTTNTNLNNQIKTYNTSLEDRINSRAAVQGNDSGYVSDYLNKNRLTR